MNHLELFKPEDQGFTVIVDGLFADHLTVDEALGCIASALFRDGKPLFVQSYEQWLVWRKRHCDAEAAGLLKYKPASELARAEHQRDQLLSKLEEIEHQRDRLLVQAEYFEQATADLTTVRDNLTGKLKEATLRLMDLTNEKAALFQELETERLQNGHLKNETKRANSACAENSSLHEDNYHLREKIKEQAAELEAMKQSQRSYPALVGPLLLHIASATTHRACCGSETAILALLDEKGHDQ